MAVNHHQKKRSTIGRQKSRKLPSEKTFRKAAYGIDVFLKEFPIGIMNRYGELVIGGRRIC